MGLTLTPMIDVVFQLVAFFVFGLNYHPERLHPTVIPPQTELEDNSQAGDSLAIEIDSQGQLLSPQGAIHLHDPNYATLLESMLVNVDATTSIVLRADRRAPYETVSRVLQACRSHGVHSLKLRLRQSPSKAGSVAN